SGALPAGLTVQPGSPTLTGTPLESGFFKVVINFTDAASHSLLVTENIGVGSATFPGISISSASDLGTAFATSFYSTQLLACCASTYTWSFVSGALPPGLAIAPTGLFSGTPSTPGLYTFVLRAADGSNSANYGQRQFTLRVLPVGVGPLFVLTSSLPSGRVSATYPQTSLQSSGGT